MAKSTINLIYSNNNLGFFSSLASIRTSINDYKQEPGFLRFTKKNEREIGRFNTYAFLPELNQLVQQGQNITTQSVRDVLHNRGLTDNQLQSKILVMLLQNKVGIQFVLGTVLANLFLSNGFPIFMHPDYHLDMKVNSSKDVTVTFNSTWLNQANLSSEKAFDVSIKFNISIDRVLLTDFSLNRLSDSAQLIKAEAIFSDHQQSFLMKIVNYIRHFLGFNSELLLEQQSVANSRP